MKQFIAVVAASLFLSGCGAVRNAQQQAQQTELAEKVKAAQETQRQIIKECKEKHERGELKSYVAMVDCSNPTIVAAWEGIDAYPDLLNLYLAARKVGAENIDKKKVTKAEAELQLAELSTRLNEERRQRNFANADMQMKQTQVASQAQAARTQSAASMMVGLAALQAANRPAASSYVTPPNPQSMTMQKVYCTNCQ